MEDNVKRLADAIQAITVTRGRMRTLRWAAFMLIPAISAVSSSVGLTGFNLPESHAIAVAECGLLIVVFVSLLACFSNWGDAMRWTQKAIDNLESIDSSPKERVVQTPQKTGVPSNLPIHAPTCPYRTNRLVADDETG